MRDTFDIKKIARSVEFRNEVNSVRVMDVKFTRNGKEIHIPQEIREEFKFTGLCTTDFACTLMQADD